VVDVDSPQIGKQWQYVFDRQTKTVRENHEENNPFLENSIKFSLIYACKHTQVKPTNISITLLQDRGFLSEPL
jgi:hypothetical protein